MNILNRNPQCAGKWCKKTILILLIVCAVIAYKHYVHGNIRIDSQIIADLRLVDFPESNDEFEEKGFYVHFNDTHGEPAIIEYWPSTTGESNVDFLIIVIKQDQDRTSSPQLLSAEYYRTGLWDVLWDLGSLGDCRSSVSIEMPDHYLYMTDYDADGKGTEYEKTLQWLIEIFGRPKD